jgi:hypothetical protein
VLWVEGANKRAYGLTTDVSDKNSQSFY